MDRPDVEIKLLRIRQMLTDNLASLRAQPVVRLSTYRKVWLDLEVAQEFIKEQRKARIRRVQPSTWE